MEMNIARSELIRALARVQGIVERRPINRIIANVLLKAQAPDSLVVVATDTETSFVATYPADVQVEGEITVGAKPLFDMARLMPTENVHLAVQEGNTVAVESGASFFRLHGLPAEDFPHVPTFEADGSNSIPSSALKRLIDCTHFAISSDDTRTGLNGTHAEAVEANGETVLRFVATDGHRLSLADQPFSGSFGETSSVLLPKKGVSELRKLCDAGSQVGLGFAENQAIFKFDDAVFSMRLLDGEFPDYQQVIPQNSRRSVTVGRQAFIEALRRVSILCSDSTRSVRIALHAEGLLASSVHAEVGEAKEEIPAHVDGDPIELGFNSSYLIDALGALTSDEVILEAGDHLSPCLLREVDSHKTLFVVMPMRLD